MVFLSFSILRDPGADSWVVRKSKRPTVYKNERGAPGILLLTDQFRNQLKSLSVIGHKNIFVPNQSLALFVLLSVEYCSANGEAMGSNPVEAL